MTGPHCVSLSLESLNNIAYVGHNFILFKWTKESPSMMYSKLLIETIEFKRGNHICIARIAKQNYMCWSQNLRENLTNESPCIT